MDEGINAGIIASGSGTDANAVMSAYNMGFMPEIADLRLISTKGSAGCIGKAAIQKIKSDVIECGSKQEVPDFNLRLSQYIKDHDIRLLILAGCVWELYPLESVLMINIHPALLPSFPGLHGQRQAVLHGAKVSGCTVHFVDENLDGGPIIIQHCVPVLEEDDEDTLAARILVHEHRCLPEAIRLFCEDRLVIDGRRVRIK